VTNDLFLAQASQRRSACKMEKMEKMEKRENEKY